MTKNLSQLNDDQLLELSCRYGAQALAARRKFEGSLPEINRRKLYLKKKCQSIYEFAAKFGGLSREQVQRVIRVEARLADKPSLHKALVTGEVSINKMSRVVSVATPENDAVLTEQLKVLPKRSVERLVQDIKAVPGHRKMVPLPEDLNLLPEVTDRLCELNNKCIDINEFLTHALDQREEFIVAAATAICESLPREPQSRHIPARTCRVLQTEYGNKCAVRRCPWMADEIHHAVPFALNPTHDPHLMAPLCHEHHTIAHAVNERVCAERREVAAAA